jgi:hypothetical protein
MSTISQGRAEPLSLRHCLRDRYNRPVPYINIWSGEMPEDTWRLATDPSLGMPGIFVPAGCRGLGEPDFTRQAPDRQRECMIGELCQICTAPAAWIVVSNSMSTKTIVYQGKKRLVITEPWICASCAKYAIEVCPGLIRRRRDDDLALVRPIEYELGYSQGWMEGPLQAKSQRELPAMWGELHIEAAVAPDGKRVTFKLADDD